MHYESICKSEFTFKTFLLKKQCHLRVNKLTSSFYFDMNYPYTIVTTFEWIACFYCVWSHPKSNSFIHWLTFLSLSCCRWLSDQCVSSKWHQRAGQVWTDCLGSVIISAQSSRSQKSNSTLWMTFKSYAGLWLTLPNLGWDFLCYLNKSL